MFRFKMANKNLLLKFVLARNFPIFVFKYKIYEQKRIRLGGRW